MSAQAADDAVVAVLWKHLGIAFGDDQRDADAAWDHVRQIGRAATKLLRDPNYERSGSAPRKQELARQVRALVYLALELQEAATSQEPSA